MGRKRKAEDPEGVVGIADPPPAVLPADAEGQPEAAATPEIPGEQPAELPVTPRNRPAASFAAMSDRTTRVEIAVWARQVKVGEGEEYTQYALTVSRAWRDKDGNWTSNAFHRVHDVPVLLYLVQQAYQWCLAQRTQVRVEADGDVPF
ncbi:MAG TPA: hypothetical protein VD866_16560 [Urbifossiella sp.]|nr:hypothetical protein [Urbifossiella sp.]